MKKLLTVLIAASLAFVVNAQTYLNGSGLPSSYTGFMSQGLTKSTTTWVDGVANSVETIGNGEAASFAADNRQDYATYGLVTTRSNTAMSAPFAIAQGNVGGSSTTLQAVENGVDVGTQVNVSYVMSRIAYTSGQILYQYSSDSTNWTTFYTSTVSPTGSYYVAVQIYGGPHTVRKWFKTGSATASPVNTVTTPVTVNTPATTTTLTGSVTTSSGTITGVLWTQLSGPSSASITAPTSNSTGVSGLVVGAYVFTYTSTNSLGNSTASNVTVSVVQVSTTPTASTQGSITVVTPTTLASLNGYASTPSGTISSRAWTMVSGPNSPTIANAAVDTTLVSGLVVGTYVFRYTVTNSFGVSVFSDLTINVINAGASTAFSFTNIASTTDLPDYGRGLEQWTNDQWAVPFPTNGSPQTGNCYDNYYRFKWWEIQNDDSSFTWTFFDSKINAAISANRKFNLAVMPMAESDPKASAGGHPMSYPLFMHTLMQAEGTPDWYSTSLGQWVINWNSPQYLRAWGKLQRMIRDHINAGSFNGVPYKNVIGIVDIRGFGNYGEWHTYPWTGEITSPYQPTFATIKSIIDSNLTYFPNYLAVIQHEAFGGTNDGNAQPNLQGQYYALTATNNKGQIGWRRDSWGWAGTWFPGFLESNPTSYAGNAFSPLIMNKWKLAPVTGEPMQCCTQDYGFTGNYYGDLPRQAALYHLSKLGNGNLEAIGTSATNGNMQTTGHAIGHRLILTGGNASALTPGSSFTVNLDWQNVGSTPAYYDWFVTYELRSSTGTAVWTGTSAFRPRLFLPASTSTRATDNFTLTNTVPTGSYGLYVKIIDSLAYMAPMKLGINGRTTDGAYLLQNVTVGSASATISAGSPQTIQAPASSVTLSATQTGGLTTPTWTQISGPTTATFSAATSMTTTASGLVPGTYVFSVTMYSGATPYTSMVTVTVVQVHVNTAPTVNAGFDQSLLYPAQTSTTLNATGTDADGFVASYQWTQVAGPNTAVIATPTLATTLISGLTTGTYRFAVVAVDNQSLASAPDTVQIVLSSVVNTPPVAVPGPAQTINTSTTSLSGTGTDVDGTIASYLWVKVSGSGGVIASPTSATTTVTGLSVGVYVFSLMVTDNLGATGSANLTVTVTASGGTSYKYVKSATSSTIYTTTPPHRKVVILYTDNSTEVIEYNSGGAVIMVVRQGYSYIDGFRRLVVYIRYSDGTYRIISKIAI